MTGRSPFCWTVARAFKIMNIYSEAIGPLAANCYIYNGNIIDPGDDVPALLAFIDSSGVQPEKILLTHGHFDHILGAAELKRRFGCRIGISEADAPMLHDRALCLAEFGSETPFEPLVPDFYLESCPEYEIIPTPGHTKGSVCIYYNEAKLLFSGDTLFYHGFGRTDFPGGSMMELVASLRKLFELPYDTTVLPGHGESGILGEIKKSYFR